MEKDEPKQRGKAVRLQAGVRGGLASVSPSTCPHGPALALHNLWSLQSPVHLLRAEVTLKEGTRPHARNRGDAQVGQGKESIHLCPVQRVGVHGLDKLSIESEKRGRPHKSCVGVPSAMA